ncbi:hypothetical protein Pcinc_043684 [Petrolisthes cinctipes]|uniref:Uncharacterized protein n=1 Tax=Petrolisthes cinctipes TaxID=88211 RepID=A0AAE1EFW8_PETCI|nr:hypothetical protein Pcinc_043684 [Petrolisthes cinctipes]
MIYIVYTDPLSSVVSAAVMREPVLAMSHPPPGDCLMPPYCLTLTPLYSCCLTLTPSIPLLIHPDSPILLLIHPGPPIPLLSHPDCPFIPAVSP